MKSRTPTAKETSIRHRADESNRGPQPSKDRDHTTDRTDLVWLLTWGALAAASYAPLEQPVYQWLALLALAGYITVPSTHPVWRPILAWHFGFFMVGSSWVYVSLLHYSPIPTVLCLTLTTLMALFLASIPTLVLHGWAWCRRWWPRGWQNSLTWCTVSWASAYLMSESMRTYLHDPWLSIAHAHTRGLWSWSAPLCGEYGTVLLAMGSSYAMATWLLRHAQLPRAGITILSCILAACSLLPLPTWTWTQALAKSGHWVVLVQGNIPQTLKWTQSGEALAMQHYVADQDIDCEDCLVIWPEVAWTRPIESEDPQSLPSHQNPGALLTGGLTVDGQGIHNSAILLDGHDHQPHRETEQVADDDHANRQQIHKRWLVPFGEYWPLGTTTRHALQALDFTITDIQAGEKQQPLFTWHDWRIIPVICYETAFAWPFEWQSRQGSLWVVITNDSWFGHSLALAQHLQMARFRALCSQKPLLFVNNNGKTSVVNKAGRIKAQLPRDTFARLPYWLEPRQGTTPMVYVSPISWCLALIITWWALCLALGWRLAASKDHATSSK